jgi:Arc/MetJ-type ribon-helix-helix transcriptional regulator
VGRLESIHAMSRNQLNIRVSDELEKLIDKKRIELASKMDVIPTRSDVVRYALELYLAVTLKDADADQRTTAAKANKARKSSK